MSNFRNKMAAGVAAIALIPTAIMAQAPAAPGAAPAAGAAAGAPGAAGRGGGGAGGAGGAGGRPAGTAVNDTSPKPPIPHLRPADEQKLFQLQPGYSISAVLTDPQIEQPGQIMFDADGRMYVLELRTYMLDADATNELTPRSRISRWEDKDGDGVYETGTTFVDNLTFPRFVMPMGKDQVLAKDSNDDNTYIYTDTNGDGKSDKKELFVTGLGRSGNVEHQEGSLTWAMDNWMYSTYNSVRVRWTPNGVLKESVGTNGAQWGVTQDNYGKLYFEGGASGLPSYFQFPILYGTFAFQQQLATGFNTPWGAPIGIGDMQGGLNSVRPGEGSLNATTAGAGANVYRGDKLPAELQGDYFYGEVVARVLRRAHPTDVEGFTQLNQVYQDQKTEFLRSMDPLFRPVDNKTAPDGTIYITDMYHGIIQEGEWALPGTYLRGKINQYALDKAIGMGRIWRLTYQGMAPDKTKPRMFEETPMQLIAHLDHPNGWWRDTAQQQLVLRNDTSAPVINALKSKALTDKNQLGRIHALWTLEGLNKIDAATVRTLMKDSDPQIRQQAIRVSETLYKAGDKTFAADYKTLSTDKDTHVQIQALLTMGYLKTPDAATIAKTMMAANSARAIQTVAQQVITPPASATGAFASTGDNPPVRTPEELERLTRGQQVFKENCAECHGPEGLGTPDGNGGKMAAQLAGDLRVQGSPEHVLRVLLHGLTGPIDGKTYSAGLMVPQTGQNDSWIADLASYVRNQLTNNAPMVTPAMVAEVRAKDATRTSPYTDATLKAVVPQPLTNQSAWKVTASQSAKVGAAAGTVSPAGALGLEGWTTGIAQTPGMWFQIELPAAVRLAGIDYQALSIAPPRGGAAGGAAAGAAAAAGRGGAPGAPGAAPAAGAPAGGAAAGAAAGAGAGAAPAARAPAPPRQATYPRGYKVEVSTDGTTWKTVEEGKGESMYNSYMFDATPAKFVKITQTATDPTAPAWGMRFLKLFALN